MKHLFESMKTKEELQKYENMMREKIANGEADLKEYDPIIKEKEKLMQYLRYKRNKSKNKEMKKKMRLKGGIPYDLNEHGNLIKSPSTEIFKTKHTEQYADNSDDENKAE